MISISEIIKKQKEKEKEEQRIKEEIKLNVCERALNVFLTNISHSKYSYTRKYSYTPTSYEYDEKTTLTIPEEKTNFFNTNKDFIEGYPLSCLYNEKLVKKTIKDCPKKFDLIVYENCMEMNFYNFY